MRSGTAMAAELRAPSPAGAGGGWDFSASGHIIVFTVRSTTELWGPEGLFFPSAPSPGVVQSFYQDFSTWAE